MRNRAKNPDTVNRKAATADAAGPANADVDTIADTGTGIDSDSALLARIVTGDQIAFGMLIDRHSDFLYATARRMGFCPDLAQDIVQETFLRTWRKAQSWSPHKGASVRTWLARIACNLCIDEGRRRRRRNEILTGDTEDLPSTDLPSTPPGHIGVDPEKQLQQKQARNAVGIALSVLPPRQRAAFILCHFQELSTRDAAGILDVSVKAIEGLLVRARKKLRAELCP